jgi:hypothetical protein
MAPWAVLFALLAAWFTINVFFVTDVRDYP